MIDGSISTRDVLLHMPTVVSAFGWMVLFHALLAVLSRRHTTFLELAMESGK